MVLSSFICPEINLPVRSISSITTSYIYNLWNTYTSTSVAAAKDVEAPHRQPSHDTRVCSFPDFFFLPFFLPPIIIVVFHLYFHPSFLIPALSCSPRRDVALFTAQQQRHPNQVTQYHPRAPFIRPVRSQCPTETSKRQIRLLERETRVEDERDEGKLSIGNFTLYCRSVT